MRFLAAITAVKLPGGVNAPRPMLFLRKTETPRRWDGAAPLAQGLAPASPGLSRSGLDSTMNGPVSGGLAVLAGRPLALNRDATVCGMPDLPSPLAMGRDGMWSCRGAA